MIEKRNMRRVLLCCSLVVALFLSVIPAQAASTSTSLTSSNVEINYAVDSGLAWKYDSTLSDENHAAWIAGNSRTNTASVSNLAVTVTEPGTLTVDYKFSTRSSGYSYCLYYNYGSAITSENNVLATSHGSYSSLRGSSNGWKTLTLNITRNMLDSNGQLTVYFAYFRGGTSVSPDGQQNDYVALANLEFESGAKEITISADSDYGTVSVLKNDAPQTFANGTPFEAEIGTKVTLTAAETSGNQFYGWVDPNTDKLYSYEHTYSFTVAGKTSVKAVFAPKGTYTAMSGGKLYTDSNPLKQALADAKSGDVVAIYKDMTISENLTVPQGVTLYIPYYDRFDLKSVLEVNKGVPTFDKNTPLGEYDNAFRYSSGEEQYNDGFDFSEVFATANKTYRTLTINEGYTLTVNGTLVVGGMISRQGQYYQGHTSGLHGRITNNGTILVDGGNIECYGFIDGTGTVDAVTGSVKEPFVVLDFAGGNNCLGLYLENQNSFMEYTMQNISCTLVIHDTASLAGYCNLYATSIFNKTDEPVVFIGGKTAYPNALIALNPGATVTRTVDKNKSISGAITGSPSNYGADVGLVNHTVSGGAKLGNLKVIVLNVTISVPHFPIPYCSSYVLENGDYTMPIGWDIMPGAALTVAQDATLDLGGRLFVLDGYKAGDMSGKSYPSTEKLKANGFATGGVFTVDGEFNIGANATFGGIIQTNGTGRVSSDKTSVLENPAVQIGGVGHYDDDTCILPLDGRVRIGQELVAMIPGALYSGDNGAAWTLPSYTVSEYATNQSVDEEPTSGKYGDVLDGNGKHHYVIHCIVPEQITVDQPMNGSFIKGGKSDGFVLINRTHYDENDATITVISDPVLADGNATFTVSRTAAGSSYNYLVQYSMGGDAITLQADANGVYTIENIDGNVTITVTSVKKGDVNLDGSIASNDVTLLRRNLAGTYAFPGELNKTAADYNADGYTASNDVTLLRRFLAN